MVPIEDQRQKRDKHNSTRAWLRASNSVHENDVMPEYHEMGTGKAGSIWTQPNDAFKAAA